MGNINYNAHCCTIFSFYQTIITEIQISIVNDRDHLELDIYVCKQQQCFLRILCNLITWSAVDRWRCTGNDQSKRMEPPLVHKYWFCKEKGYTGGQSGSPTDRYCSAQMFSHKQGLLLWMEILRLMIGSTTQSVVRRNINCEQKTNSTISHTKSWKSFIQQIHYNLI